MISESHKVPCSLIIKAISKSSLAGCLVHLDAGGTTRLAQQNLQFPEHEQDTPQLAFGARLSA